jgi:hypothetical protein
MYILQLADYLDIEVVVDNEVEEEDFEEEELGESVVISSIKFSDNIVQTFSMMILKRARQIGHDPGRSRPRFSTRRPKNCAPSQTRGGWFARRNLTVSFRSRNISSCLLRAIPIYGWFV